MAAAAKVKEYLAFWFQLGKPVSLHNGKETVLPSPVIEGDHYSDAFEACWLRLLSPNSGDCYLQGTTQTIADLLSSRWEIYGCSRCNMPVPMIDLGMQEGPCPCSDLVLWPNTVLPEPRSPVDSGARLGAIRDRLLQSSQRPSLEHYP